MTDRELLEAAARAAGMQGCAVQYDERLIFLEDGKPSTVEWNPLISDADALRLAVKLEMNIVFGANYVIVDNNVQRPTVNNASDPYAATRRAIVRAAAAMASL